MGWSKRGRGEEGGEDGRGEGKGAQGVGWGGGREQREGTVNWEKTKLAEQGEERARSREKGR